MTEIQQIPKTKADRNKELADLLDELFSGVKREVTK